MTKDKDMPIEVRGGALPEQVIEQFMRNLEEAQKQPREWWCTVCGVQWRGTRQDGPPCDCWTRTG